MIVVRADDDGLVPQDRVTARQQADHVFAREPRHMRVLGHRRVPGDGELLEPAAGGRLKPDRLKPPREVRGGGVGARAAGQPSAEPVVAEELDVVQRHDRRNDRPDDGVGSGAHLLGARWNGRGEGDAAAARPAE